MLSPHIIGQGLVVEFPLFDNAHRSLKKAVIRAATGGRFAQDAGNHLVVRALDNLNFECREGDRIGLVGHNGSGKTTLLRVLSGVFEPVRGHLEVQGRVSSILDLSMGFDPDASGLENIFLRGVMLGMRPQEIHARVNEIAEFSELGDYLHLPIRAYSSGMLLRLGFATSTSIESEILLMDEWLSVGDAEFRDKASQRLEDLANRAAILVLATHDATLVDRICNRVLRLEHGRIVEDVRKEPMQDVQAAKEDAV